MNHDNGWYFYSIQLRLHFPICQHKTVIVLLQWAKYKCETICNGKVELALN